jgi:predicted ArsR family transcriptional regulator
MMQELETISVPKVSSRGTVTGRSFAVLFALAGSDSMNAETLGNRLGLSESECRHVIDDLQRRYLVDVVSRLEGETVKETLRLTEEGEALLLRSLEQICELPERSGY